MAHGVRQAFATTLVVGDLVAQLGIKRLQGTHRGVDFTGRLITDMPQAECYSTIAVLPPRDIHDLGPGSSTGAFFRSGVLDFSHCNVPASARYFNLSPAKPLSPAHAVSTGPKPQKAGLTLS